ncbi:Predicted metal-dependent hydrolase, TIM-barrel fold [Devosia enhydra]|uniref:Predicted metal-dependent hydrolase, TIM-barrel fold n=1 Tax=Devosia enhydra TaxID=665118 RepID=A0A1K2HTN7_9HYPH|nr:amidohydrolase family protein [Devosia enhydra]SFZ80688.1 Predicted metal-dependent hydrolase, TIM-barrel fold [Devosia enhydra]
MPGLGLPDDDWLALRREPILDPGQRICDPHHHFWDRPVPGAGRFCYLFDEFLADLLTGHNIIASVAVEAGALMREGLEPGTMYRQSGPPELASLGETEFLHGYGAMAASGLYCPPGIVSGIVAFVDLRLGARVADILERHMAFGRVRGIRNLTWHHPDPAFAFSDLAIVPGTLESPGFREGFACLAKHDLAYDATAFEPQFPELLALARAFPLQRIVLNHLGGILGSGPYAGRRDEAFAFWRDGLRDLATCPNIFVKIGGMSAQRGGFDLRNRPEPASSEELARLWAPYAHTVIDLFGPARVMFESNYPVERQFVPYPVLWNAFKRLVSGYTPEERDQMLFVTAARFYRLPISI